MLGRLPPLRQLLRQVQCELLPLLYIRLLRMHSGLCQVAPNLDIGLYPELHMGRLYIGRPQVEMSLISLCTWRFANEWTVETDHH
jgi:hypothetical protein